VRASAPPLVTVNVCGVYSRTAPSACGPAMQNAVSCAEPGDADDDTVTEPLHEPPEPSGI